MRSVVAALLLATAACHGANQTGPAWPAPSTTADDGGESIAPHERSVTAAVEKSEDIDDDDEVVKPAATAPTAPAKSEDKPATPAAQPTAPSDDVIITDEIIIEIDD